METIQAISLALGAAWASGINLYAAILVLGYFGSTGQVTLPPELQVLQEPLVLMAAGLMYLVEFFADKIPGVDTAWDAIHSFIRIPAGALLAAGAASGISMDPGIELAAALVGGSLAAGSHFTKAGTRILINTSPEPVSNWAASFSEDLLVIAGLWTALNYPTTFLVLLVVFIILLIFLLPKLWRLIASVFRRIGGWFKGEKRAPEPLENQGDSRNRKNDPQDVLKSLYHNANKEQK